MQAYEVSEDLVSAKYSLTAFDDMLSIEILLNQMGPSARAVIATRAVLRVLPFVLPRDESDLLSEDRYLSTFLVCFFSWAACSLRPEQIDRGLAIAVDFDAPGFNGNDQRAYFAVRSSVYPAVSIRDFPDNLNATAKALYWANRAIEADSDIKEQFRSALFEDVDLFKKIGLIDASTVIKSRLWPSVIPFSALKK